MRIKAYRNRENTFRMIAWSDNNVFYIIASYLNPIATYTKTGMVADVDYCFRDYAKHFNNKDAANKHFNTLHIRIGDLIATTATAFDEKRATDYMERLAECDAKRNEIIERIAEIENKFGADAKREEDAARIERLEREKEIENMKIG
jgi:hypothetical protein